jgi:hypothetical protein
MNFQSTNAELPLRGWWTVKTDAAMMARESPGETRR